MDGSSVVGALKVTPGVKVFSHTWSNPTKLIVTFSATFKDNTTYKITVGTGARDLAGNHLAAAHSWSFTTKLGEDPVYPNDSDGDGVPDTEDAFPDDPLEWNDTDTDGVGDNADEFPDDPLEWSDTDEDGTGDNSDEFPEDTSKWEENGGDGKMPGKDEYKWLRPAFIAVVVATIVIIGLFFFLRGRGKKPEGTDEKIVRNKQFQQPIQRAYFPRR
jgi:hypothetical protein